MHNSEDLILDIPAGSGYIWPQEMYETLIIAIYFPYLNRFPWELQKTNLKVGVVSHLRDLLKKDQRLGEDILSKLFQQTRGMDALPLSKLRKLLLRRPRSGFSS